MNAYELIDKLEKEHDLIDEEFGFLIEMQDEKAQDYLHARARHVREKHYGRKVYIRGLIEYSNYCKNDCLYCGIRRGNRNAERYRLSKEEILQCCEVGYDLGFRTFVLQGGEDPHFTDERMVEIVKTIRGLYPDCAITLSIGEKSKESYHALFGRAWTREF